ncbi:hypothetical protein Hanom_Chr13g01198481 [Helianthus anomalus]
MWNIINDVTTTKSKHASYEDMLKKDINSHRKRRSPLESRIGSAVPESGTESNHSAWVREPDRKKGHTRLSQYSFRITGKRVSD